MERSSIVLGVHYRVLYWFSFRISKYTSRKTDDEVDAEEFHGYLKNFIEGRKELNECRQTQRYLPNKKLLLKVQGGFMTVWRQFCASIHFEI